MEVPASRGEDILSLRAMVVEVDYEVVTKERLREENAI